MTRPMSRHMSRLLTATLLFLPFAAAAQEPERKIERPNPQNGAMLAERWCATCHVVSKSQTRATDGTRSFAAIAQSPDFNVEKLAFFLLDPHPVMPNMTLSRDEARDIAAYIATQK
jgi:mono/diheme cytochrome c family protein